MHRPSKRQRVKPPPSPPEPGFMPPSPEGRIDHPYRLREPTDRLVSTPTLLSVRSSDPDPRVGGDPSRVLWSRYQPWQGDLFDNPLWNERRGVYECPTCGVYATKEQFRHWYHPGGHQRWFKDAYRWAPGSDTPFMRDPHDDLFGDDERWEAAERLRQAKNNMAGAEYHYIAPHTTTRRGEPGDPRAHRIRYPTGLVGQLPPTVACSEQCYMAQLHHNERRKDLLNWALSKKERGSFSTPHERINPIWYKGGAMEHAQWYPNLKTYEPITDIFDDE